MSRFLCTFKLFGLMVVHLAAFGSLAACELETVPLSSASDITAFELRMADNPSLSQNVSGTLSDSSITLMVPADTDVTSLVPTIQFTGETLSPASGEAQDFTDPVVYTVTAVDGSETVYTVTVYVAAASSKDIRSFRIGSTQATIDGTSISLTLPYGTDRTRLTPVIGHTGVEISPESNAEQDFSSPVQYVVTAQDGSTKTYTVTINTAPSSAKEITKLKIGSVSAEINGTQITLTLPHGTDLRGLKPTITHTGGSVEPDSGSAQDFRGPVTYLVTAADGSSQTYTVTVQLAPSTSKNITQFSIDGVAAEISGSAITATVPYGTDITYLAPVVQHTGASLSPASAAPRDFTQPVTYTVTAADGSTKKYTVTISIAPNTAKEIIDFVILGSTADINGSTITLTVPFGANQAALVPTIVHSGTLLEPASGVMQDFTEPVEYVVSAADGTKHTYTVIVTVAKSSANSIERFSLLNVEAMVTNGAITVTLPFGTDVSDVAPEIEHTGASIEPAVGIQLNFLSQQTYTVTAANGDTRVYNVNVSIAADTAKTITRFALLGHEAEIDGTSITLTLPPKTPVTSLTPDITHLGASIEPGEDEAQDFTNPVKYTVTAANNSTAEYTVTVTVAKDDDHEITGFTILNIDGNIGVGTIALTVPFGTDLTELAPTVSIAGVSVEPASGMAQDFSAPVTYTVTAENGNTKDYIVTVNEAPSNVKTITSFEILGKTASIQGTAITLTLPYNTDRTQLVPSIQISGTKVEPASGAPQNFTNPVLYRVTAADNSFTDFVVTVTNAKNDAKNITGFTIQGATGDIGNDTITVTLPYGTNRTALAPQITISGDSVTPESNVPRDFTSPRTYTVMASDGTTKQYTVTVQLAMNDAKDILTFDIMGATSNITTNAVSLTVPFNTDPATLTPTISVSGVEITPASGVPQDFRNPVEYMVKAEDGTIKTYTVTVTVAKSDAKDISSFKIGSAQGNIVGSAISVTVPHGSDASSLTPTITSTGVLVEPGSGVPNDFGTAKEYVVTADDGTKKTYTVTVTVAKSDAKDITAFTILGVPGSIAGNAISITLPHGNSKSALMPVIDHTGQSVSPASGAQTDFTSMVPYTVTAEDGTTKVYNVTVDVAENDAKDITSFKILGATGTIVADAIAITLPYGTPKNNLTPTIAHTGDEVAPASGVPNDFTAPAMYTVTADDGSMKTYTVTVTIAPNTAKEITSFKILGVDGTIGDGTVALIVPYNTPRTSLSPTIVHNGSSIAPASGTPQDFSSPFDYVVTADDGSMKTWTVTVTVAANSAKDISTFSIMGLQGTVGANTVTLTVPYGTDLTTLTPTVAFTGASVNPASGMAQNFTNPVTYTVTADDESTKDYTITVTNAGAAIDCRALLAAFPATTSGVHTVDPDGAGVIAPFPVYCDMTNHGGGWTLIGKTAAGDYTALTDDAYLDLIVNPSSDVNANLLQTPDVPNAGEIAFFSKAKTNALYHASGALRAVRVNMSGYVAQPVANNNYFQQRVNAPNNWDFWLALRNARMWNDDASAADPPDDAFVNHFGSHFVLTNLADDFDSTTNVVTHRGDGTFGFFSMYTHTLPDTITTVEVSRHFGLLNDGVDDLGMLWLLTADQDDARYKYDVDMEQKSLIWLR